MDRSELMAEDEGKPVVDATGEKIGTVTEVSGDAAFVDPDPGITDVIRSKLGWGGAGQEEYRLEASRIDVVTDDEIRLTD